VVAVLCAVRAALPSVLPRAVGCPNLIGPRESLSLMIRDPLTHFQPERPVLQDAARFFGLLRETQSAGSETHRKATRPPVCPYVLYVSVLGGFRLPLALSLQYNCVNSV
jgi:hypothetical protein